MGCLRHPRTTQERRANGRRDRLCIDGYCIKTRAKRNMINLPEAWDDVVRDYRQRSWKLFRRTQYKPWRPSMN